MRMNDIVNEIIVHIPIHTKASTTQVVATLVKQALYIVSNQRLHTAGMVSASRVLWI